MATDTFFVGKTPLITIDDCAGDLVIRPWLNLDIQAKGTYKVVEDGKGLSFESPGNLLLHVPEGSSVHAKRVVGDVVIRSLMGEVNLIIVQGDVVLSNLGKATIGRVHGDLVASNLSGSLAVEQVDGDVAVRNVDGNLSLGLGNGDASLQFVTGSLTVGELVGDLNIRTANGAVQVGKVHRDANLRSLGGPCDVQHVIGDIRLLGGLGPFDNHLRADGDIVVRWPPDSPLLLEVEAPSIENRLPLQDVIEKDATLSGRLGDGKTRLGLKAGGTVILKESQLVNKEWDSGSDPAFDFDFIAELASLGARISSEVGEQVARVTAELESNLGPEFMQRMAEQFAQKANKAAAWAKPGAAAAEGEARQTPASKAKKPQEAGDERSQKSVSKVEAQLKILRMVENGIISPDEASMLLEALEGE